MTSIVICEKPSQARNVAAAVGSRYGDVLPCLGHLLRLEEPQEVNPDWKYWNKDLLVPPKGRYGFVPDSGPGKSSFYSKLRNAIRSASQVIIATDCDREGQGIGQSLLEHLGFRGTVKRAMFASEDPTTLAKAIAGSEPNSKFETLYQAFIARQQADQIFNLTLTRVATTVLRQQGTKGVIGVGRVKSPTLGILYRREKEIQAFKKADYFEIDLTVVGASGTVILRYGPDDNKRIFVRDFADQLAASAQSFRGPIAVKTERKRSAPPRPFDLPTLEQSANTLWGWTVKKTDELAQKLYEGPKITTYPRAECQYLPEAMIPEIDGLVGQLKQVVSLAKLPVGAPNIRTGKDGVFSDAKLAGSSHHAIIPNVNCPGGIAAAAAALGPDEAKLFELIARRFLASVAEDYIYDHTSMSVPIEAPALDAKPFEFTTSGSVAVSHGWRNIYSSDDDASPSPLPKLPDGELVQASKVEVLSKVTVPPKRFTEAGLIKEMQNAAKYIEDPAERARLEEAKGIGTPATRSETIESLKRQKLIVLDARNLVPTTAGMMLCDVFVDAAPMIIDPGATARMEARLDDILHGRATADQVINEIVAMAKIASERIQQSPIRVDLEKAISFKKAAGAASPAPRASSRPAPRVGARPAAVGSKSTGKPAYLQKAKPAPVAPQPAVPIADRVYLNVPSAAQKEAWNLKARWDPATMRWWVSKSADLQPFKMRGWLK
ncbi:MAG: DNA topoisomerase III [Stutzerimonas stutzeri]|nr:MAG: DNA topoisomerase III [Stutzerimonas stutzeri]